jgi:hypothetical protein
MTLNLPPDPNDSRAQVAGPTPFPPPHQPQPAPVYAGPVFPDGSQGAPYREPLVVTRRNNQLVARWVIGFGVLLVVIVGVGLVFVALASGMLF